MIKLYFTKKQGFVTVTKTLKVTITKVVDTIRKYESKGWRDISDYSTTQCAYKTLINQ